MRVCDQCGVKLPPFKPRTRLWDDSLVCDGCHPDKRGEPGRPIDVHASKTLHCDDCLAPMGDGGMVVTAGKITCAGGCQKTAVTWFENAGGEYYDTEVPDVGEAHVRMELSGNPLTHTGRWEWETYPYDGPGTSGMVDTLDEAKAAALESLNGNQISLFGSTAGAPVSRPSCFDCGRDFADSPGVTCRAWHLHDPRWRKKTSSLQVVAHDSGDGATIYHCPFCGAGQVTARSDGTVECGFCNNYFTVQVQPTHQAMPQTDPKTGQPLNMPGMPGDPATHQAPVPEAKPDDPGFAPEGTGGDEGFAPAGTQGAQFLPAGTGNHVRAASRKVAWDKDEWDERHDPDEDDEPCTCCDGSGEHPSGHECYRCDGSGQEKGASGECDPQTLSKGATKTALYLTPDGVAIPEKSYIASLALRFADDRDAVLQQVRHERTAR